MSAALKLDLPGRMTVAEFLIWDPPAEYADLRWSLVDGVPVCMAPPRIDHGAIQSQVARLLGNWLERHRPGCRVITTPGINPRVRSSTNYRIPDLGVSCGPVLPEQMLSEPLVLIEILSPSNEKDTRSNVWAYTTIPSVQEIVLLSLAAVGAELFRRGADGNWPAEPIPLTEGDALELRSLGYREPLASHYATSSLALR